MLILLFITFPPLFIFIPLALLLLFPIFFIFPLRLYILGAFLIFSFEYIIEAFLIFIFNDLLLYFLLIYLYFHTFMPIIFLF